MKNFRVNFFYLFLGCLFLSMSYTIELFAIPSSILKTISSNEFGLDKKGELVIYDKNKWFCISNNGYIFVSNCHQHNICKFSLDGKFITKFGQKGEGPGDLYFPCNLTILENKYLLTDEYAAKKRISMFDLNGKFIKIIRTKRSVFGIEALDNNYIYYSYYKDEKSSKKGFGDSYSYIIIKNIILEKELIVDKIFQSYSGYTDKQKYYSFTLDLHSIRGRVNVQSTNNGNILFGLTNTQYLKEFSKKGKLIKTIHLKIPKRFVENKDIEIYKKNSLKRITHSMKTSLFANRTNIAIKSYKSMPYEKFFRKTLPYYDKFLVDKNGDIIIIIKNWSKDIWVKLYSSKDGSLIKQKKYIDKQYIFETSKLVYSSKYGLYGFFQKKDSDDVDIRIVKLDWE